MIYQTIIHRFIYQTIYSIKRSFEEFWDADLLRAAAAPEDQNPSLSNFYNHAFLIQDCIYFNFFKEHYIRDHIIAGGAVSAEKMGPKKHHKSPFYYHVFLLFFPFAILVNPPGNMVSYINIKNDVNRQQKIMILVGK